MMTAAEGRGLVSGETEQGRQDRRTDHRWAAAGGMATAVVGFGGMAIVGSATSFEAQRLLSAVLPTVRFAASAYVAGGATILALMLTLITFSIRHDIDFRTTHYRRIREIAALTTAVIAGSVLLLMFVSFPLDEADVERSYHLWVYYGILLGGAVAGGLFISTVLMLFYAVRQLVFLGEDAEESELVDDSSDSRSLDSA